jgi:hypothetical protein
VTWIVTWPDLTAVASGQIKSIAGIGTAAHLTFDQEPKGIS